MLHPTGSEPPQVYWRRRVLVLLIGLGLVAGLSWTIWAINAPQEKAAPLATLAPEVSPVAPAVSSSVSASPPVSASTIPTPSLAGGQPCLSTDLRVDLAGYRKVKQTSSQRFKVAIRNAGVAPCLLAVGASNFSLTVTSGKDRIWSTTDCAKWVPAKRAVLKPGQAAEFGIDWSLRRSKPVCGSAEGKLSPGTYVAEPVLAAIAGDPLVMVVTKG